MPLGMAKKTKLSVPKIIIFFRELVKYSCAASKPVMKAKTQPTNSHKEIKTKIKAY